MILRVLDTRDPLSSRSSQIENLVSKKPEKHLAFVLKLANLDYYKTKDKQTCALRSLLLRGQPI